MSEWIAIYNWAVDQGLSAVEARAALEAYLEAKKQAH